MTTTPDSFSTEQLELALKTAVKEDEVTKPMFEIRAEANPEAPFNGMDIEQLKDYAEDIIEGMLDDQPHVMAAKYLACRLIANIANQQHEVGEMLVKEGNGEDAIAWFKDSGRLWCIQEALRGVEIHNKDFIAEDDARHNAGYHGLI